MKTSWLGVGVVMLLTPLAWAETIDASSRITKVTVYPDRALITREAELTLTKGMHRVRFGQSLPPSIEAGSMSAKGQGEARVTIHGVELVTQQLEQPQDPRVQDLTLQLKQLNRQQQELSDLEQTLREEREFLASIQAASIDQIGKDLVTRQPDVKTVDELMALLDRELSHNASRMREVSWKREDLKERLDRIQRELAQLQGPRIRATTAIVVELEAEQPGRFFLEVGYRIPGATWEPMYEARASTGATQITFGSFALVRQRTGEDWPNIQLTLSTARPALAGHMPELEPWYLWQQEVRALYEKGLPIMGGRAPLLDLEQQRAAAPEAMKEAQLAQAMVQPQGPAVMYQLEKPITIAGDWQPRKVPLRQEGLEAEIAYEATPKLVPHAFLRAKVKNTSEAFFLPGPVQVFLDGSFVGTSSLEAIASGETFDLFLGVDERIQIKRKQLKAKVDVSVLPTVHGRIKTIDYEYLTTIENRTPKPISLTVIDQEPVSQHDEIKLEQVKWEPTPTESDSERPGVYRWRLTIPAGQQQELRSSFRIRHPVQMMVSGL